MTVPMKRVVIGRIGRPVAYTRQQQLQLRAAVRANVPRQQQPPANPLPSFPENPKPIEVPQPNQFPQVADSSTGLIEEVNADLTRDQMSKWLLRSGFEMLVTTFAHFTGADILRLTRDDLAQMCGLPDGIRLYYALRSRPPVSMCVYVNLPGQQYYNAIYLTQSRRNDFLNKLTCLMSVTENYISDVFFIGPHNIHVQLTDDFIRNLPNESTFSVHVVKGNSSDNCCILLKPTSTQ